MKWCDVEEEEYMENFRNAFVSKSLMFISLARVTK